MKKNERKKPWTAPSRISRANTLIFDAGIFLKIQLRIVNVTEHFFEVV
jgi:hypothetical protein